MTQFFPLLISLVILLLSLLGVTTNTTSTLQKLFSPLSNNIINTRINLQNLSLNLRALPTLTRQLRDLERQNQELLSKVNNYSSLEKELQACEKNTHPSRQLVPVKIVSLTNTATIISPDVKLIKINQPLVSDNTLIGTVKQTFLHTAQVDLVSQKEIPLKVVTNSGLTADFSTLGTDSIITTSDKSIPLNINEPIYTQGSEDIPSGLLVGKVKEITSLASDPIQKAIIAPSVSLNSFNQDLTVIVNF